MRRELLRFIRISLVFTFGCSTCWQHPVKTNDQFAYDEILCTSYGTNKAGMIPSNYQTNYNYRYGYGSGSGTANTYDSNALLRVWMQEHSKEDCIRALGWVEVPCD